LNLGALELPKDQWKALVNAIEERVNNQSELSFSDCAEEVDRYADHIVLEQMKAYGFDEILSNIGFSSKQIDYAKHLVHGRAVHPSSERKLARWINENSAVKELIQSDERVYDNALHRSAAQLFEHRKEIEQGLIKKANDIFSLDEKIILYDLTNTYFEGRKAGSEIAQSKGKRINCKLATLALVVDAEGFPKGSRILEGNISEPETFAEMLESKATTPASGTRAKRRRFCSKTEKPN
jgi:hypothetical protein|tara:strand:+ start:1814 stop:2527 length:714 start_codon:yes stop_codon:yes gene_type:complete